LQNTFDVLEDIVIPDAKNAIAAGCEISITNLIGGVTGVLSAIDLNDQSLLAAYEIDVITSDWVLAGKI
jgi:hypothetical protein